MSRKTNLMEDSKIINNYFDLTCSDDDCQIPATKLEEELKSSMQDSSSCPQARTKSVVNDAGSSSGARKNENVETNVGTNQQHQAIHDECNSLLSSPMTINANCGSISQSANLMNKEERKRVNDRNYRQRIKEEKQKMEDNIQILKAENNELKAENEHMMEERDAMNQKLQSADHQTKNFRSEIVNMNSTAITQQHLVDLYSNQLVNTNPCDRELELRQLENEKEILMESNWENWDTIRAQLMEEISNLEVENQQLKIQSQALSDLFYKLQHP